MFTILPGLKSEVSSFTLDERVWVDDERVSICDYIPDPDKYKLDVERETLAEAFTNWLENRIRVTYKNCNQDVLAVIERLNTYDKKQFGVLFLKSRNHGQCYRYLQKIDGKPISRQELYEWFAKLADYRIAQIIDTTWIHPRENHGWKKLKVDMTKPPLSAYQISYPESNAVLKGFRKKQLPQYAREIKEDNLERWAAKEKEKELRKASKQ